MNPAKINEHFVEQALVLHHSLTPLTQLISFANLHQLMTAFKVSEITIEEVHCNDDNNGYMDTRPVSATYEDAAIEEAGGLDFVLSTIKSVFNVELERSEFNEDIAQVIHYLEDEFVNEYLDEASGIDYEEILRGLQQVGETRIDIEMVEALISKTVKEFIEHKKQVNFALAEICNLIDDKVTDDEAK
ncbi:hypothetical protein [Alteromonas gracilis]|uniref:hypothetical protein n=1 Tax=Alteromonas gracilis TaxID=1479524 RepID=UPI0037368842